MLPSRTELNYQRLGFGSLIFGRARIWLGFLYFLKSRLELEFGSNSSRSSSVRARSFKARLIIAWARSFVSSIISSFVSSISSSFVSSFASSVRSSFMSSVRSSFVSSFEFVCELVYDLEKKIDSLASYTISKKYNKNTNNLIQQVVNNN